MISGDMLKYYREKANLTTKELAKRINAPKVIVELWEVGKKMPREKDIAKLCEIYGISESDLIIVPKHNHRIIISIILGIISIIIGFIVKSIVIGIFAPIMVAILFLTTMCIKDNFSKSSDIPKTLFSLPLDGIGLKERVHYYLVDALCISSTYIIFNIICKILGLYQIIINKSLVDNIDLNYAIIWSSLFLLLSVLVFIIEFVIGEYLKKQYKENNHEWWGN